MFFFLSESLNACFCIRQVVNGKLHVPLDFFFIYLFIFFLFLSIDFSVLLPCMTVYLFVSASVFFFFCFLRCSVFFCVGYYILFCLFIYLRKSLKTSKCIRMRMFHCVCIYEHRDLYKKKIRCVSFCSCWIMECEEMLQVW